jgi:hypothetical protein
MVKTTNISARNRPEFHAWIMFLVTASWLQLIPASCDGKGEPNVMKTNLLTKRVMGFVFGLSLLLGIGMAASSVAHAQYRDPNWQREQDRRQREWERQQRRRQRESNRDLRRDRNGRYDGDTAQQYNWGGSYELRQTALNAGYNEGIKEGRKDRSNGDRFDYRDEEDYRNANTNYNSRLGSRELYRQYFRQGFQNGYTDGYRGY